MNKKVRDEMFEAVVTGELYFVTTSHKDSYRLIEPYEFMHPQAILGDVSHIVDSYWDWSDGFVEC